MMNVLKCDAVVEVSHGDLDRLSRGEELVVNFQQQTIVLRVPVRRRTAVDRGEADTFGGPRPRTTRLNEVDDQRTLSEVNDSARQQAIEQADRVAKEFERRRGAGGDPLRHLLGPGELAEG